MTVIKYISIAIVSICSTLSFTSYATGRATDDVFSAYSTSNISSTYIYSTYHTSTYHTSTPLSPIASTTAPQLTSTTFDTQEHSDIHGRMNASSNDPFGGGTLPNLPSQPGAVPVGDMPIGFSLLLLTIYILSIACKQYSISSK